MSQLTLGQAIDWRTHRGEWGCACPGPWPICNCTRVERQIDALQRAAHIAIKMIADYARREHGEGCP